MATKSLITRVEVDRALRAHNCQANHRHRLERGHARLKVRNGRSWDHYCVTCAKEILARDVARLTQLLGRFRTPSPVDDASYEEARPSLPHGLRSEG